VPRPVDRDFVGAYYGARDPIPVDRTVVLDGYRGVQVHLYSLVPISVNAKYFLRQENATICHPAIPYLPGGHFRAEPRGTRPSRHVAAAPNLRPGVGLRNRVHSSSPGDPAGTPLTAAKVVS
jgi:hypothetical protein